jgi:hypothetical protein
MLKIKSLTRDSRRSFLPNLKYSPLLPRLFYIVDSYFLDPLIFLYSPDPSHLVEDGLVDNNLQVANLGADILKDSEAYYFLADSFALLETEPACHSL